ICLSHTGSATIGRRARSVTGSRPAVTGGSGSISAWIEGVSSVKFTICVTRARVSPYAFAAAARASDSLLRTRRSLSWARARTRATRTTRNCALEHRLAGWPEPRNATANVAVALTRPAVLSGGIEPGPLANACQLRHGGLAGDPS